MTNSNGTLTEDGLFRLIHEISLHETSMTKAFTLCALRELQERRKADSAEPIGWTDAEELRSVENDGCGYLFKANPITPNADPRRVIKLYAVPQPLNDAERAELQERRKADRAEPVSFDELNAAVAEVTGCSMHAWDARFYKGHQAVPFMNYNSLARMVDKYRTPQPVIMGMRSICPQCNKTRNVDCVCYGKSGGYNG